MPTFGAIARRVCIATGLALLVAAPVAAQQPLATVPQEPEFFSRFDFIMSASALGNDDDRFSWDTHWAGDLDLVDYKYGRATFLADYQALLGSEFRPFDPYQSNYLLEASSSYRLGATEIAGVLSHISRHLGDRPKRLAVAENSLGVRAMRQISGGRETIDLRFDARKVIATAYVDYTWIADADVAVRRPVRPHLALFAHVYGQGIGVDPDVAGRATQYGGKIEGGTRISGTGGAVELFAGIERMIDADPLDRLPRHWAYVGFRLMRR